MICGRCGEHDRDCECVMTEPCKPTILVSDLMALVEGWRDSEHLLLASHFADELESLIKEKSK